MTETTNMGFTGMPEAAYPCTAAQLLTEPGGPVTVPQALHRVFDRRPQNELMEWIGSHRDFLVQEGIAEEGFRIGRIEPPKCFSLLEQSSDRVFVDLLFPVQLTDRQTRRVDFCLRYQLDLRPCGGRCTGPLIYTVPSDYRIRLRRDHIETGEWLLPVMRRGDFDTAATDLLKTYLPEALHTCTPVSGDALARAMGLTVEEIILPPEREEQALLLAFPTRILLEENGILVEKRFPGGTILLNRRRCRDGLERNIALLHECAHKYLDRLYFLLQHASRLHPAPSAPRVRTFDWMEYQAEKLAYHLALPAAAVLPVIQPLLGVNPSPDKLRQCAMMLSRIWQVSPQMARLRLIALGWPAANGILASVDGIAIPDHSCGSTWPDGETFTISAAQARRLMVEDAAFRTTVQSGRYAFREGHFCLRTALANDGQLSPWARAHMEQCCLRFRVSGGGRRGEGSCTSAARRRNDVYRSRYEFTGEPGSVDDEAQLTAFIHGAERWEALSHSLPPTFAEALKTIMKQLDISQQKLADTLFADRNVVKRMLKPDYHVTLRHLAAVCVAIDIPYFIAVQLMQRTGTFPSPGKEGRLLNMMLLNTDSLTIPKCNEIMRKAGLPPIIEAPNAQRNGDKPC